MKREILADKGVWTGKKRYFLNVWDKEGVRYTEPKIKISGLEAIRSDTPAHCRQKIKDTISIIINQDEQAVWKFIADYREEFPTLPIESIASPSTINGMAKYKDREQIYTKGCPMHVRAGLVYNDVLRKHNLEKKYEPIKEGTKIKYLQLKEPNPFQSNVIGFENDIPKELNIEKYIDFEAQFSKSYLNPITAILIKIGWTPKRVNTLESYFA